MTANGCRTGFGLAVSLAFATGLAACDRAASPIAPTEASLSRPGGASAPTASSQASPLVIGGTWHYQEETFLVFPGWIAGELGLEPEGPVLELSCSSPDGVLTIVQVGSTFTGTLEHPTGSCRTKGGQAAPTPWALPYRSTLSGRVTGRALQLDQVDDPPDPAGPVTCPKTGTIQVAGGVAIALETVGRCDLSSFPFRPATATNRATATRP